MKLAVVGAAPHQHGLIRAVARMLGVSDLELVEGAGDHHGLVVLAPGVPDSGSGSKAVPWGDFAGPFVSLLKRTAHDLRSPAGLVQGGLSGLQGEGDEAPEVAIARRGGLQVAALADRLDGLVSVLGGQKENVSPVDLRDLILNQAEALKRAYKPRRATLSADVPSQLVLAPHRSLGILLGEAVLGALRAARQQVQLSLREESGGVALRVVGDRPWRQHEPVEPFSWQARLGCAEAYLEMLLTAPSDLNGALHVGAGSLSGTTTELVLRMSAVGSRRSLRSE